MRKEINRKDIVYENLIYVYFLEDGKLFRSTRGRDSALPNLRSGSIRNRKTKIFIKKNSVVKVDTLFVGSVAGLKTAEKLSKYGIKITYAAGYSPDAKTRFSLRNKSVH